MWHHSWFWCLDQRPCSADYPFKEWGPFCRPRRKTLVSETSLQTSHAYVIYIRHMQTSRASHRTHISHRNFEILSFCYNIDFHVTHIYHFPMRVLLIQLTFTHTHTHRNELQKVSLTSKEALKLLRILNFWPQKSLYKQCLNELGTPEAITYHDFLKVCLSFSFN